MNTGRGVPLEHLRASSLGGPPTPAPKRSHRTRCHSYHCFRSHCRHFIHSTVLSAQDACGCALCPAAFCGLCNGQLVRLAIYVSHSILVTCILELLAVSIVSPLVAAALPARSQA
eukprot:625036-Amphidinium_carterae.1